EKASEEREIANRQTRIRTHEALKRLDDFLAGNITHAVRARYSGISIGTFAEVFEEGGRYDKGVKLLTLFGDKKCGLSWHLNDYRDGSGSYTEIFPCTSLEDAKAVAQSKLDALFDLARRGERVSYLSEHIASALKDGLAVP